jgi:ribosomal-protein-alanine N-acetyltransferase
MDEKKEIAVSLLSLEDAEAIGAVCELVKPFQGPAFDWPEAKLRIQLQLGRTFLACDKKTGKLCAFVHCMDVGAAVELPILATAVSSRDQSVMQQLLERVIATHYRARELWLEVHEQNAAARKLYRKLGFIESGRRVGYYKDKSAAILCTKLPEKS